MGVFDFNWRDEGIRQSTNGAHGEYADERLEKS